MQEGIVVVGHGSPAADGENNRIYFQIADLIKQKADNYLVETAILIRQNGFPSLEDAIRKLAALGVRKITVAPAFLSNGVHIIKDIPAEIARLSAELPGINAGIGRLHR